MAEDWSVVPSRPKRPSQHNGSSLLEEKVASARHTSTVSQQKRHNSSRASDQGAIPQKNDGTTFTSQQRSPKERGNEVPRRSESQSQTGQNTVHTTAICLMRRPVSHKPPQSELSTTSTSTSNTESQLTGKSSDDDIRDKIGAPIIRHSPRTGSSVDTLSRPQQRAVSDRDFNTGQYPAGNDGLRSSQYTSGQPISRMGHKMSRGGLLVLQPKPEAEKEKAAVALDLSSDDQWPSISSRDESGSVQEVWLTSSEAKGWSDALKKTTPMGVVKRKSVSNQSSEENEGENPVICSGEDKEAKKKRRRKKKGSGEAVTEEEKILDKPQLLDLSQYMAQAAVRPLLNRKDAKSAKEVSGNVLDSTAPVMRRGKERENPKAKKPTNLRKIIEKEKAVKRQLREQGLEIPPDFDVMKEEKDQSDDSIRSSHLEPVQLVNEATSNTQPTHEATPTNQPSFQATPTNQLVPQATPTNQSIHGRRFREYCSHVVTDEINSAVELLLQDLVRFQDRQYHRDPVRAKSKRRYVCGLREVHKHLTLDKLKCVIIPPNLDHIQSTGGIDERVCTILTLCCEKKVQVVHAMSRKRLAFILKKKYMIGCVGIFSYDGAETHYKRLLTLVEEATEHYQKITLNKTRRVSKENIHEQTSTTHDPQDTNSVHSSNSQDDVSPVPDPRNGIGTLPTDSQAMDTPWRIFFPETCTTTQTVTSDSTNQTAHDISTNQSVHDVTDNSTNQNAHDVTGESTNKRTEGETVPTEPTNQNTGNVDFHVTNKGFHWNVDATEFIPSFL